VQLHTGTVLAVRTSTYVVRYQDTTLVETPAGRKGRLTQIAQGWIWGLAGIGGLIGSDHGEVFKPGPGGWELIGTSTSIAAVESFDLYSGSRLVFGAGDGTLHSILNGVQCRAVPLFSTPLVGIGQLPNSDVLVTIGAPVTGMIPVVALKYPR
jgi:hypothetical protein